MEGSWSTHFLTALLILLTFTSYITSSSASKVARKTSTEFIRTSCNATTYPTLCFNSLSSHASAIQASPHLLADTALSVTLKTTQSTSTMMLKLSQMHGLKPREVAAMREMSDIQTWVSAALTNDDTCTDGFAGKAMNGNVKNIVRRRIVKLAHMTSNALALINSYASLRG